MRTHFLTPVALLLSGLGCPKPDSPPPPETPLHGAPAPVQPPAPREHDQGGSANAPAVAESSVRIDLPPDANEPDRWLWVETPREGTAGGWATGSFDPKRNKLDIRTKDVTRFVIDVGRIPIDWKRVVVLGIDGKNSELRRRDFTRLHFVLDAHGQWVIHEP